MKTSFLKIATAAVLAVGAACINIPAAMAQAWPSRPITLIVPSPAGGGTDILGRTLAQKMSEALGQPVIVENKAGASGMIGVGYVARQAPADGYTLLLGALGSLVLTPNMYSKVPFDARADFAPVSLSGRFDFVLVTNPQVMPAANLKEFVEAARAQPGKINYASPAPGTMHHLTTELFARQAGLSLVPIQYKGGAPAMQDVIAGHVPMMFLDVATALPHIRSGKLRALAVTSDKRIGSLPSVPTIAESGYPGFNAYAWQGIVVRSGTPGDIIAKLAKSHAQAMADPAVREKLLAASVEPMQSSPAEFADVIKADHAKWSQVIKAAGISAD